MNTKIFFVLEFMNYPLFFMYSKYPMLLKQAGLGYIVLMIFLPFYLMLL